MWLLRIGGRSLVSSNYTYFAPINRRNHPKPTIQGEKIWAGAKIHQNRTPLETDTWTVDFYRIEFTFGDSNDPHPSLIEKKHVRGSKLIQGRARAELGNFQIAVSRGVWF